MLCWSILSYFFVSSFFICLVQVKGMSMIPTLENGERFVVNRLVYKLREPVRGELVILRDPLHRELAVKRIIGIPNDHLKIMNGTVHLNGEPLEEQYLYLEDNTFTSFHGKKEIVVDEGYYFVLGDNRTNSEDSRHYGLVAREDLVGLLNH